MGDAGERARCVAEGSCVPLPAAELNGLDTRVGRIVFRAAPVDGDSAGFLKGAVGERLERARLLDGFVGEVCALVLRGAEQGGPAASAGFEQKHVVGDLTRAVRRVGVMGEHSEARAAGDKKKLVAGVLPSAVKRGIVGNVQIAAQQI